MNPEAKLRIAKTKNEKESAFEEIYEKYKNLLFFIILQIIKDKQTTEELVNDVFLNFFNNIDKIDLTKNIKYYLTTSARNLSFNYLKKKKEKIIFDEKIVYEQVDEGRNNWQQLMEAFSPLLTEEEIIITSWHLFYNFSFKEIANNLNCSINVAFGKYNRALKKIKKYYKESNH